MMKKRIPLIISAVLFILFVAGYINLKQNIIKKVAVINLQEMYQDFEMTKLKNIEYKSFANSKDLQIDSLSKMIPFVQAEEEMQQKKLQLVYEQIQNLQKEKEQVKYEYEQQIWGQLNQYLDEFGGKGEYALIHGSLNQGSILYAEDPVDITDDVIVFVNDKYNGLR